LTFPGHPGPVKNFIASFCDGQAPSSAVHWKHAVRPHPVAGIGSARTIATKRMRAEPPKEVMSAPPERIPRARAPAPSACSPGARYLERSFRDDPEGAQGEAKDPP